MKSPVFYRLTPGNIRDVSAFKLSMEEAGIKDAIIVADKGFYSKANIDNLKDKGLKYIMPLRRRSKDIDYAKKRGSFFQYKDRFVWYFQDGEIISYCEESLRSKEENDYLGRIISESEGYSEKEFHEKRAEFGSFTISTNLKIREENLKELQAIKKGKPVEIKKSDGKSPREIYEIYKSRCEVEIMAENLKTTLHADASYMRDNKGMEGWMFINYIALLWYYRIYNLLLEKNALQKLSPKDILQHLQEVRKIKVDGKWHDCEIGGKSRVIFEKVGITLR